MRNPEVGSVTRRRVLADRTAEKMRMPTQREADELAAL
jgi:hypothetical protein